MKQKNKMNRFQVIATTSFFYVLLFSSNVGAVIFDVNSNIDAKDISPGDGICETSTGNAICSLRAAIEETNALASDDEINLPAGIYKNSSINTLPATLLVTDSLFINGDTTGETIIDGMMLDSVFTINEGVANDRIYVSFRDLIIQNGNAEQGGGVKVISLRTIAEIIFNLTDSNLRDNRASISGAGIYYGIANGSSDIIASVIENNGPSDPAITKLLGAGIHFNPSSTNSTISILGSTIRGNTGNNGAGIHLSHGFGFIYTSTVSGNNAKSDSSSTTVIPGLGGGISVLGTAELSIKNNTISGNSSESKGGGIYIADKAKLQLVSATISNNQASNLLNKGMGGGVYVTPIRNTNIVTILNTIIAGNSSDGKGPDCDMLNQQLASKGGNLIGNVTGCTLTATVSDQFGTSQNIVDPLLEVLKNNGGSTETHALKLNSPAVDKIGIRSCLSTDGFTALIQDQRLFRGTTNRAVDGGSGFVLCDIGAYELHIKPIANAGVDLDVKINTKGTLDGSLSQAFYPITNYHWTQVPQATVTLNDPTLIKPFFTAPSIKQNLTFKLTITDSNGSQSSDEVVVRIYGQVQLPGPTPIPTEPDSNTNSSPSSSGGCSLNKFAKFDPLLIIFLILAVFQLNRFRLNKVLESIRKPKSGI